MQSMRYCQYNLGEGSSEALLDDLRNHHDHVPQVNLPSCPIPVTSIL